MDDAIVLLQTEKHLATAIFCPESICWSNDSFSFNRFSIFGDKNQPQPFLKTESERISQLLSHIKLLIRRKTGAIFTLDVVEPLDISLKLLMAAVEPHRDSWPIVTCI
ncbi:uncharacterized protein Fot_49586 [Forsythia ovata]|uniref:Maturase K n=1 Tax=Forsythia ovata TaxID=205694 RepID=A0ABD1QCA4_9LAMI